jgi:hypothetical protein
MKTNELSGAALDWAVAKCEGVDVSWCPNPYEPIVNWSIAGPIIEREMIELEWSGTEWWSRIWVDEDFSGPTPLIAAMRCYVASKLGDEVEIPEELQEEEVK